MRGPGLASKPRLLLSPAWVLTAAPACMQVAADNAVAVRMYEKCGYQVVGRTTDSPLHWIMQVGPVQVEAQSHHLQAAPCTGVCM